MRSERQHAFTSHHSFCVSACSSPDQYHRRACNQWHSELVHCSFAACLSGPPASLIKTATLISFLLFNSFSIISSYGFSSPDFILPSVLPSRLRINSRWRLFAWNVNYEARAPRTNLPSGQSWGDSMIKLWRNMSSKVRTREPIPFRFFFWYGADHSFCVGDSWIHSIL